jgi:choline dehydrogenase-like flavoprotein
MKNKKVNAVVVGSGAGGGVVAKELSTAGLSVVLLERGGWISYDDHTDDELISQPIAPLGLSCGPDVTQYRRVIVYPDGSSRIVLPNEPDYNNIAACVGSGTVTYAALAWRYMQEDFRMKSTYGYVPGSTIEDWPISYDDLEPCYEKAEWEIGVSGDDSQNPFAPPRKKTQPMPPFSHNRAARLLDAAARRLGFHPFHMPFLRNSIPYGGRPACIRMRNCNGYPCPVNAKCGTQNTVIPVALASGNCELRTHSVVNEIMLNEQGKITGVSYFDKNNRKKIQSADIVVISASAIETARLLLNSKSKFFPSGIGNENGWVGKNLQGHAYPKAFGLFHDEVYDDLGPGSSVAICDFNHHNPGIVGGGYLGNSFFNRPYAFTDLRPPGAKLWGKEHKEFQRLNYKKLIKVHGPYQEIPRFDQRVEVDPVVKDFWGTPVARLIPSTIDTDTEGCNFIASKAEQWLIEAGAYFTWKSPGTGKEVGAQSHQAGTCRMGNDPKTSVTDKYGRIHPTSNLFVADASLHVTNGGFNPSLTIMALGYWVGGYIASEWNKGTRFKS